MRSFNKIIAKIAACFIVIGMVLMVVGFSNGASPRSLSISINDKFRIFSDSKSENTYTNVPAIITDNSYQETYDDVRSIDLSVDYGEVIVEQGDRFAISAENIDSHELDSHVEGGTWVIDSDSRGSWNVFGINFGSNKSNDNVKIKISVPKDFHAEELYLNIGAGTITIDSLSGDDVYINVGAGVLKADNLIAENEASFEAGAGEISVQNVNINNLELDNGIGKTVMNGKIIGESSIDCGVGQVILNLDGDVRDYGFQIDSGVGDVVINDNSYNFTSSSEYGNMESANYFDIDCGIGNVTIKLK